MLDSVPATQKPHSSAQITGDGNDAQMRVGLRTAAFGAVEIYTSVHQNQVGLTLHGTRELTQWFSSEVQAIESRLNDQHLNLASLDMQNSSAGLQTGTGAHHHPPTQSFVGAPRAPSADTPDASGTADEPAPSGPAIEFEEKRVSILI